MCFYDNHLFWQFCVLIGWRPTTYFWHNGCLENAESCIVFSEGSVKLRILEFKAVDDNSFVFGSTGVYPILSVLLSLDKNLFNDVDCVSQRFCRCVFFLTKCFPFHFLSGRLQCYQCVVS